MKKEIIGLQTNLSHLSHLSEQLRAVYRCDTGRQRYERAGALIAEIKDLSAAWSDRRAGVVFDVPGKDPRVEPVLVDVDGRLYSPDELGLAELLHLRRVWVA